MDTVITYVLALIVSTGPADNPVTTLEFDERPAARHADIDACLDHGRKLLQQRTAEPLSVPRRAYVSCMPFPSRHTNVMKKAMWATPEK